MKDTQSSHATRFCVALAIAFITTIILIVAAAAPAAQAQTYTVLYSFTGGTDGGSPFARLVRDPGGNLYGTTMYEGDLSCGVLYGCGTVFQLDANGIFSVLHTSSELTGLHHREV